MALRSAATAASALALILWPLAIAAAPPDAAAQLQAALSAPTHLTYVGEIDNFRFGSGGTRAAIFRVEHRAPNLTRRWYIAPHSAYGQTEIERGDTTYVLDPTRHRVLIERNRALDDRIVIADNVGLMLRNYKPVRQHAVRLLGHPVDVIALVNKYTGDTMMRLWIDTQTHLVLERKTYGDDGVLLTEERFEQLAYVKTLSDRLFAIPKNLTRVERTVHHRPTNDIARIIHLLSFKVHRPRYLPDGFLAIAADRATTHGVEQAHLLYSDGIRMISLFENSSASINLDTLHSRVVHIGRIPGTLASRGATSLLAWSSRGMHYALVGSLDGDELAKIAASVGH